MTILPSKCTFRGGLAFSVLLSTFGNDLREYGNRLVGCESSADPAYLLKAFLLANIQQNYLGVGHFVALEPIASIEQNCDICVLQRQRGLGDFVKRTPSETKRSGSI